MTIIIHVTTAPVTSATDTTQHNNKFCQPKGIKCLI